MSTDTWGFPKIRGTFLGVPIIRIIIFWGLYWGPHILGNYHIHSHAAIEAVAISHEKKSSNALARTLTFQKPTRREMFDVVVCQVVSKHKVAPVKNPKYCSPYYGDPHKATAYLCRPHMFSKKPLRSKPRHLCSTKTNLKKAELRLMTT